jgi:glycosyltransferase involved in cell wall biosynthesis
MAVSVETLRAGSEAAPGFDDTASCPPTVSVVIPTLNEAENLPYVLARVPDWIHEIVIVDGHSRDDTVAVASAFPQVKVVYASERGKGVALRAGFEASTGEIIVAMDADGSTDPAEIPAFLGVLRSGADVAMGSRFACGGGTSDMEMHRRLGNWALTRIVGLAFGAHYSDLCYGYFAFWAHVLDDLTGDFTGFEVETVMHIRAVRAGLKVAEVPSYEARRISGVSNLRTIRDGLRVARAIGQELRLQRQDRARAAARRTLDLVADSASIAT